MTDNFENQENNQDTKYHGGRVFFIAFAVLIAALIGLKYLLQWLNA